jgi:hypothetical protein
MNKEYKIKNKENLIEKNKIYNQNNKEKRKIYYEENKDRIQTKRQEYYVKNKEKINEKKKEYLKNNKEKINVKRSKYLKNKYKTDILFKIKIISRNMINKSLKRNGYIKNSRTYEILGCTYEEFIMYLESKFESWMNWDNYGLYNGTENYGWDIDHIIPLSTIMNENDIFKLNNYTNLQPLCSYINRDVKINNPNY